MLYSIDCTARINAQDPDYPTYKKVDCTFHCNANDNNFYGKLIDCTFSITTLVVTAAKNWNQGIRIKVIIDNVDVSSALVESINIRHDKNMISTFSLNLGDTTYVPISNPHIDLDKIVVITSYINGQEKKLFTGLIDNIGVENTPLNIAINGFGYGIKLSDKKTTIVSVQDLARPYWASTTKRSDIIRYLAQQAGVTDVDIPEMDTVTINNSFSDQSVWDMIQKEAMVELYWVRFNEDGVMQLKLDDIKTDTATYPTADWTYGENRFERLNYIKSKEDIINKIIVAGHTTQHVIENYSGEYDISAHGSHTWAGGEAANTYSGSASGFTITCADWGGSSSYRHYGIKLSYSGSFQYIEGNAVVTGDGRFKSIYYRPDLQCVYINIFRYNFRSNPVSVDWFIRGYRKDVTTETRYDQISVEVTDPNSIEKYGEKDGGSIEYPLLETEAQCEAVGSKHIQDKHQNIVNTSFRIPFNPLITPGQTIQFSDSKIGLTTERYYAKGLTHIINPSGGSNTEVECVYYA